MHYFNDKLISWVEDVLREKRKNSSTTSTELLLKYADYLLEKLETLENYGGTSYTDGLYSPIKVVKNLIISKKISNKLGSQLLDNFKNKIFEAMDTFKRNYGQGHENN